VWMLENGRSRRWVAGCRKGDSWFIEAFTTLSRADASQVHGYEMRNGLGLRMGWAFLAHDTDRRVSEVRELFVMPAFRQQGVGNYLEALCTAQARYNDSDEVHLVLNQSDAVVGPPRATARGFGTRRGYSWRWRNDPRLRSSAIGVKRLDAS
jgi:GNAT superfamily N-acetyltransferase